MKNLLKLQTLNEYNKNKSEKLNIKKLNNSNKQVHNQRITQIDD